MKKPHLISNLLCCFLLLLSGQLLAQPANNTCAGATNVTVVGACGGTTGQTLYQSNATGSPASGYGPTNDVWYTFTPAAGTTSVQIALSATGASITNTNTFIEAFNATTCAGVTVVNSIGIAQRQHGLTLANLGNSQYYFRVFTNGNANSGSNAAWGFTVCVSSIAAPANDNCGTPTVLTVGTSATGRINGATASAVPVGTATGTPDDDVWFRFNASSTTQHIFVNPNHNSSASTTLLAASGAGVQLYSGTCPGGLTPIAFSERGTIYATGLTSGATYFVRVYSLGAHGSTPVGAPSNNGVNFNILVTAAAATTASVSSSRMNEIYRQTILSPANMLNDPWEVTYGADGFLWVTESKGYRVLRINPNTGARSTVLDLTRGSWFFSGADRDFNTKLELNYSNPQGGFAGLALHPNFMDPIPANAKNFVYVSYTMNYAGGSSPNGINYVNALARFTYNTTTGKLEQPVMLCDTIPGSNDHNSQRLGTVKVGGQWFLVYAAGDMGAGQFGNTQRIIKAQHPRAYEGKILRFNLESDGDAGGNAWIPDDNPYNVALGTESAVWAIGIRNNQGFVYDEQNDHLYGSSHGPFSDDEINILEAGRNYGHPHVIGYSWDDNVNNTTAGAAMNMSPAHPSSCPVITDESTNAANLGPAYKDPLFSGYPNSPAFPNITTLWNTTTGSNGQWPSEGWSGLDLYKNTIIPGWKQSLVAASLKWGRLVKIRLTPDGDTLAPIAGLDTVSYFGSTNRYRDLAFAPNGKDIFVVLDRNATSSGPSASDPIVPACAGCLQKYTFLGYNDVGGKSSIPSVIDVATPTANNTCVEATKVVINAANFNNNIWVPITGPDGNILAEIHAGGQNLDTVRSFFYKKTGGVRTVNNRAYLDRSFTITPDVQPGGNVRIRLYFTKAEYLAFAAHPLSGISSNMGQLRILKNSDPCSAAVSSNTTLISPTFTDTANLTHNADAYVLQATINSFSSFYIGTGNLTLPLDLLTFTGSLQGNDAQLHWETANEINTSHFVVERSIDNTTFDAIGTVTAAGNTSAVTRYNYTDMDAASLPTTTVYYRIRMYDIDGSFKYSNTILINLADVANRVTVYPNPAHSDVKVTIAASADGRAAWKITDNSGRVVMQSSTLLKKGNNNMTINVDKLAAGIYYLNINGNGIDRMVKLQKL